MSSDIEKMAFLAILLPTLAAPMSLVAISMSLLPISLAHFSKRRLLV